MAYITTRINGTTSANNYGYYANVIVNDAINSNNTFTVDVNTYLVNNGTRTNSSGWDVNTRIDGVDSETLTNQTVNTTGVAKTGGEILIHSKTFFVPVSYGTMFVAGYLTKSSYTSYDPGACYFSAVISLPRVQSTWASSLLNIPNIENAFTLPINKYVSSYYNVVEVRNSNNTQLIKTINDAVNGTSITFTSSELNSIYAIDNNTNQLPLVFYLDLKTFTDSSKTTQIGTTQRLKCEAYIVNGEPTINSYTIQETNQAVIDVLGDNPDTVLPNFSELLYTIDVSTKNGATVKSVKVNNESAELDGNVYKITVVPISEFSGITVTDSRNLVADEDVYLYTCPYVLPKINTGWTVERVSPISSDLVLNATIDAYNDYINQEHINSVTIQYSLDNENWTTIPSSSYTYSDYLITINDLTLSNLIPYNQEGRFYLRAVDLFTESNDSFRVSKGIETYSWGENDLQVNGEIYIADEEGENEHPIREYIIEESGNGYIKFANGTMICYGIQQPTTSVSSSYGSLYASGLITGSNFAKEFTTINSVVLTPLRGGTFWLGTAETGTTVSKVKIPNYYILSGSTLGSQTFTIGYTAIGTWK